MRTQLNKFHSNVILVVARNKQNHFQQKILFVYIIHYTYIQKMIIKRRPTSLICTEGGTKLWSYHFERVFIRVLLTEIWIYTFLLIRISIFLEVGQNFVQNRDGITKRNYQMPTTWTMVLRMIWKLEGYKNWWHFHIREISSNFYYKKLLFHPFKTIDT